MLPDFGQSTAPQPRRGVVARPQRSRRSMIPVIILSISVLTAGAAILYWTLGPQPEVGSAASAPPPPEPSASAVVATSLDPDQALSDAWRKARSWHREAALVRLEISAVSSGKLEPSAQLTATFAKPKARLGPGQPVAAERYRVKRSLDGQSSEETTGSETDRAAPDPACPVSAAWRAAVASGLPSKQPLRLSYAFSDTFGRAIWQARPETGDDHRNLDGVSCNILAR